MMPPVKAPGNVSDCYFVGRVSLLKWISELLNEPVKKVEDLASGHHYCMALNLVYPGQVNMHRVRMNAINEWERSENFKIIQDVLSRNNIDKGIDVNKLVTGKYMDNFEFFQWFKWFFDQNYKGSKSGATESGSANAVTKVSKSGNRSGSTAASIQNPKASSTSGPSIDSKELEDLRRQIAKGQLESQFYFDKLHEIEIYMDQMNELMTQVEIAEPEDSPFYIKSVVKKIEDILYAEYHQ
ncbi:Microtubule binding protein [Giardia duodenalis]|uniref:Microtubule binding protein n=1 Tax=Giardia intestinalis TaxID=5741 RepID=V6TCF5_GIAIN|nr:Microtubule binding protein [Giardia intestinalis]